MWVYGPARRPISLWATCAPSNRAYDGRSWKITACPILGAVVVAAAAGAAGRWRPNISSCRGTRAELAKMLLLLLLFGVPRSSFGRGGHDGGAACASRVAHDASHTRSRRRAHGCMRGSL